MNTYKTTETAGTGRRRMSLLVYPAAFLSLASLAWTCWSLTDLIGAGSIGITVAVGADVIWAAVILAEYRGIRVQVWGWNAVPLFGWLALAAVGALLAWHGIASGSAAMAWAGPFLPLGGKIVWTLALADMRDPSDLTDSDRQTLADMERGFRFEEAEHALTLRRQIMCAEKLLSRVETDFTVELKRDELRRELARNRPLELEPVKVQPVQGPDQLFDTAEPVAVHTDRLTVQPTDQVQVLVDRLRTGEQLSKSSAAQLLGVSESTAHRRLRKARLLIESGTGQYL